VYGPYGRPDMAIFKFTKNIINNKKINLFNHGKHTRDFTFINYVAESVVKIIDKSPSKKIPYEIYPEISGKITKTFSYEDHDSDYSKHDDRK
jgi:nucleoside-diphosphate-sugar epimerase